MLVISFSLHPSERDLVSVFHDIAYAPGAPETAPAVPLGLFSFLELHLIVIRPGSTRRRLPALLLKYDNCWSLMLLTPPQGRLASCLSLEQKHWWPARAWQELRTPNWCVSAAVTPAAPAPRPSEPHEPKPRLPEGPRAMGATSRCGVATREPEHTAVRCSSH